MPIQEVRHHKFMNKAILETKKIKPGKTELFSIEADGNFKTVKTISCKRYERLCLPFDGTISFKVEQP